MKDSPTILKEFIDSARRSRKYPDNTAAAFKVALRLFESELNEEEKASVEKLKENLDRIYAAVFDKNKTKYSSGSLDAYRKRVSKLINDYLTYGVDPSKMNSWSPPVRRVTARRSSKHQAEQSSAQYASTPLGDVTPTATPGTAQLDWPFDNKGRKAVLILPVDLSASEADTIKGLIDLRIVDHKENGGN
jgi:hypothetical protein